MRLGKKEGGGELLVGALTKDSLERNSKIIIEEDNEGNRAKIMIYIL